MDSTSHPSFHHQNHQPNSGLLKFRSAPSSLFANFTETEGFESEKLISRFMNSGSAASNFQEFEEKTPVTATEAAVNYTNSPQSYSGLPPQYPRQSGATSSSSMESSYGLVSSTAMDHHSQGKPVRSSLVRQSSSPAGLFANHSVQNGFANMKGMGNYSGLNGTSEDVSPSTNRLKTQLSFSSRLPSSLGILSQISEIRTEDVGPGSPDDSKLANSTGDSQFYTPGFSYFGSWNTTSHFVENFSGLKRDRDTERKLFPGPQNLLSHHLSLPKTSTEVAMDKFLQFQDSVPCKVRAKRGCATHPRSIAERVRRTRISERMRKLQELVPNMDKQTNTADMLDLAVEYIKDLQKQFKTLTDNRANCKCLSSQKPVTNQVM